MSEPWEESRPERPMIEHGGRLRAAAARYRIPLDEWLDLSTGINPAGWPVPPLGPACWQRLPEAEDGLGEAAQRYYGGRHLLAVAGSQAAIQALPALRPPCRVGVIRPGYAEHGAAWLAAGHRVEGFSGAEVEERLDTLDVAVLISPNNPTGERFPVDLLLDWHRRLARRGGWLVVDEAFMDCTPAASLAPSTGQAGLVVLRSLGKFFGLAGARVGFVLAWPGLLTDLDRHLGPWAVAGPAREAAHRAFLDLPWQEAARQRLLTDSERLRRLLDAYGFPPDGGTALFQWARTPRATALHEALARQGILTRLFTEPAALRFGLPGDETQWRRLEAALAGCAGEALRAGSA